MIWVSKLNPDFDRATVPGWLLALLDSDDRSAIVNAELNCSTGYYISLLSERRQELDGAQVRRYRRDVPGGHEHVTVVRHRDAV